MFRIRIGIGTALSLVIVLAALASLAAAGEEGSESLRRDFDAAVVRLQEVRPVVVKNQVRPIPPELRIGFDPFVPEAASLVKKYGPAAAGFARPIAEKQATNVPQGIARALALIILAELGEDADAAKVLIRLNVDSNFRDGEAELAATYAPPSLGRVLGREALEAANRSGSLRLETGRFLRFFGEAADAEPFRRTIEALPTAPTFMAQDIRNAVLADLIAMEQRLHRPTEERAAWSEQDRSLWRALRSEAPDTHSKMGDLEFARKSLMARGRLSAAYLKDRLAATPIVIDEMWIILWAAAEQRELAVIPDLARMLAEERSRWSLALEILLGFDTPESFQEVKRVIRPREGITKAEAAYRVKIIAYLTTEAGLGSMMSLGKVRFLGELSEDPAFPASERATFSSAADRSRRELESYEQMRESMKRGAQEFLEQLKKSGGTGRQPGSGK